MSSCFFCRRGLEGQRSLTTNTFKLETDAAGRNYATIVHFADRTNALHCGVNALHYGLLWGQSRSKMAEDVGPEFENWKVSGLRGFFLARMFPCVTRQKLCSFRIVIWPFLFDYNPRNHSMSMLLRALVKLSREGFICWIAV